MEYRTTHGTHLNGPPDDPEPPSDDPDWIMVGAAASGSALYWFWARYTDEGPE